MTTPDLPPEVRAAIERVLVLHQSEHVNVAYCRACVICTELQALLLLPESPTVGVTDEKRVRELREAAADLLATGVLRHQWNRLRAAVQAWDEPT